MKAKNMTLVITDPCYLKGEKPYIKESTIYGDWSCMCYKGTEREAKEKSKKWDRAYFRTFRKYNSITSEEERNRLNNKFQLMKRKWVKDNCYGEFCADAGMVAVYDYDKLREESKEWIKKHPWCACIIPDYTGNVEYVVEDGSGTAHIVGDGFYTIQSGF